MRIDKDSLGCIWPLVALSVVVAIGLSEVAGFTFWPALLISCVVIGIASVSTIYLLDRTQALENRVLKCIDDPLFGMIQRKKDGWVGEVHFAPTCYNVEIFIDATASGPSDSQRQLYEQILQRYNELLPEIHEALVRFVGQEQNFMLLEIEIPRQKKSARWTGQYVAETEDGGDMAYFVDVVDWHVNAVTGVD